MCGRCTASQIAAASAASFFPRLPVIRYGVTNFGAIKPHRVAQRLETARAQWCAPEQASMPIKHGGSAATSAFS